MRQDIAGGGDKSPAAGQSPHPEWSQLLVDAVAKPGVISAAYQRFHDFSVGNQLLALWQCAARGIEAGPIHTFVGWKELGRFVRKGEKALTLCMPVTAKCRQQHKTVDAAQSQLALDVENEVSGGSVDSTAAEPSTFTLFTYKPHWFVLSQTDGAVYVPTALPQWSEERALEILKIARLTFAHPSGNCQGYAMGQSVAVSPVAVLPHKTLFHEMAHVLLGHTAEAQGILDDHEFTPRSLREAEAESVALIVCESLNLAGTEFCRGYIQHWLAGQPIPERSAQKIFKAADRILKAGYPAASPTAHPPASASGVMTG